MPRRTTRRTSRTRNPLDMRAIGRNMDIALTVQLEPVEQTYSDDGGATWHTRPMLAIIYRGQSYGYVRADTDPNTAMLKARRAVEEMHQFMDGADRREGKIPTGGGRAIMGRFADDRTA